MVVREVMKMRSMLLETGGILIMTGQELGCTVFSYVENRTWKQWARNYRTGTPRVCKIRERIADEDYA